MAVQTFAAGDSHVAQWFLALYHEKHFSPLFLNESTVSQSVLSEKKTDAKFSLPHSVPAAPESLLHIHANGLVNSCLQNFSLHAKLHWKTEYRAGATLQVVARAWSALSGSIRPGKLPYSLLASLRPC